MKELMLKICSTVYKVLTRQQLTPKEKLFNIKNCKIITIISGICWTSWYSMSLGLSASGFIKGMTELSNIIYSFIAVVFEIVLHFAIYNKITKKEMLIKSADQLDDLIVKTNNAIKSKGKELKPTLAKFLGQLKKPEILKKYDDKVVTAIKYAQPYEFAFITDFSKLETLLNETTLNETEKLEVITYYYSKNFIFFDQYAEKDILIESDDKTAKLQLSIEFSDKKMYERYKSGFEQAKEYIDEQGNILPKKNDGTDDDIRVINIQNSLTLSEKYIKAILKSANQKWYKNIKDMEKKKEIEKELTTKLAKIRSDEMAISAILIDHLSKLMFLAKWNNEDIEQIKKELNDKLKGKQIQKEKINTIKNTQRQKDMQEANKIINELLNKDNDYEPLRFINSNEIDQLKKAMTILEYKSDKITLILRKIEIYNNKLLEEELLKRCNQYRENIFELIAQDDANLSLVKCSDIYTKGVKIINNPDVLDASLNYYKEQISFWIGYINEIVKTNFNLPISKKMVEEIKAAIVEIDKYFSEIYTINNASNRTLIKFDESEN